jgi:hypothetical protein
VAKRKLDPGSVVRKGEISLKKRKKKKLDPGSVVRKGEISLSPRRQRRGIK